MTNFDVNQGDDACVETRFRETQRVVDITDERAQEREFWSMLVRGVYCVSDPNFVSLCRKWHPERYH
jgi:hypothetical protein